SEVVSAETLRKFVVEKLPDYMVPDFFIQLDEIPLTPTGKIDYRALPAPQQIVTAPAAQFKPAQSDEEKIILDIFQQILKRTDISVTDSFFTLGGNSLNAVQVISRINASFDSSFPVKIIFEFPQVERLAAYAHEHTTATKIEKPVFSRIDRNKPIL